MPCVNCCEEFKTKKKGFYRVPFDKSLPIFNTIFPSISKSCVHDSFLCITCHNLLQKIDKISKQLKCSSDLFIARRNTKSCLLTEKLSLKRKIVDVSPHILPKFVKLETTDSKRKAVYHITKSNYLTAQRILMKSKSCMKSVIKEIKRTLHSELKIYLKTSTKLCKDFNIKNIEDFSWLTVAIELTEKCPIFYSVLETVTNLKRNQGETGSQDQIGLILSIITNMNNPRKYNFLQRLNGVQMWSSGCKQSLFECFNHMHLSMGVKGTCNAIDKIRVEYNKSILGWKNQIEAENKDDDNDNNNLDRKDMAANGQQLDSDPNNGCPIHEETGGGEDGGEVALIKHPGYSITWDNVQLLSTTRHHYGEQKNKMHMWALAFTVQNRVSFRDDDCGDILRCEEIPLFKMLPCRDDIIQSRRRMEILVTRILIRNMDFFASCKKHEHVTHKYWKELSQKSKVVNLGVIEENPSSTDSVIKILEHLHQYVPNGDTLDPFVIPCHGDGLSVERHSDARRARVTSQTVKDRLLGLEPVSQEWHKRCLVIQDTMDDFYHQNSTGDRGTLINIKNVFRHTNVKKDVSQSFSYVADLMKFVAEGMVCLLTMKILSMDHLNSVPLGSENICDEQRETILHNTSKHIVQFIWHNTDIDEVIDAKDFARDTLEQEQLELDDEDDEEEEEIDSIEYCFCKQAIGGEMVKCSNGQCPNGRWFHVSCVLENGKIPDGDWTCSEYCSHFSIFCVCLLQRHHHSHELECSAKERCTGGRFFHMDCMGLDEVPANEWYCSIQCQTHLNEDYLLNYSKALLWRCLNDLARRDALREGDGEAMIQNWKLDIPGMYNHHHNKYLILTHRLLSGQNGWLPRRIREEIKWNRTANTRGGPGNNKELDLVNEHLNKDFKGNLKHCRGQYTEDTIARTSQIVGTIGQDIDRVYRNLTSTTSAHTGTRKPNCKEDVERFTEFYRSDKLFNYIPGREHSAFPKFQHVTRVKKNIEAENAIQTVFKKARQS